MKWRTGCWILGIVLVAGGIFLPRDWYDVLPKQVDLPPPPVKGVTLLQMSFVLEGLALIWLSLKRWTFTRLRDVERLPRALTCDDDKAGRGRTSLGILAAITLLALFLRLWHVGSDLWLDEITPILDYGRLSALEVVGTFLSTNNHLLNTLLMKLSVAYFGEQEWAVRLPAVLFGIATIPVLYWVARIALSRWASLGAALLLAVSYHHIFFSQNARGYSAYLFFSLLSSGLLVRGLQEDRLRIWILYAVTMLLDFAALLNSVFVFAAHILVGVVAVFVAERQGASPMPLVKRLSAVFVTTGFLVFQLYATVLPQIYVNITTTYTGPGTGFSPFSRDFLNELIRGLSAGFGTGVILGVIPFLLLAGAGLLILFRIQWALTIALAMPGILMAFFLIVKGLTFSPRFFLLALPLAILAAIQGLDSFARLVARGLGKNEDVFSPRAAIAMVLVLSAVSLASLGRYYAMPKQAYQESLQYLEAERKPGEIVVVIHVAEKGYRYYGKRLGIREGEDYFFVRSVEALDSVLSSRRGQRSYLVTTFPRALRFHSPELAMRIAKGWAVARSFPGTIGDGAISIWKQRQP